MQRCVSFEKKKLATPPSEATMPKIAEMRSQSTLPDPITNPYTVAVDFSSSCSRYSIFMP
jgi:hypothetical protein